MSILRSNKPSAATVEVAAETSAAGAGDPRGTAPSTGPLAPAVDPRLASAYAEALEQGCQPLDLDGVADYLHRDAVVAHLARWNNWLVGGPCSYCASLLPRIDPRRQHDGPVFAQLDGRPACGWCAAHGDVDSLRAVLLCAIAHTRTPMYLAPSELLPLAFEVGAQPAKMPFAYITGDMFLAVREWAAEAIEGCELKRILKTSDLSRVPGIAGLDRVVTSKIPVATYQHPLDGYPVKRGFGGLAYPERMDPRSRHIPKPAFVQQFVDLVTQSKTAPTRAERAALGAQAQELMPAVAAWTEKTAATKAANRAARQR